MKILPIILRNKDNKIIYHEYEDGYWYRYEYDDNGNELYYENSKKCWYKQEFDSNNIRLYYEDNYGDIVDKRKNDI